MKTFKEYLIEKVKLSNNLKKLKDYLSIKDKSNNTQYEQLYDEYQDIQYHDMKLIDFWKNQISKSNKINKIEFGKWVLSQIKLGNFDGNTWQNVLTPKEITDEWFIHFTDYVDEIMKDGFLFGVPLDKLTQLYDTRKIDKEDKKISNKNGFIFAYRLKTYIPTEYEIKNMNFILFKGSAIEFKHKLDNEKQCVVDIKTISNKIPFYYSNNNYYVLDNNKQKTLLDKKLSLKEKCEWIIKNNEII
jgi:hypothetical protein